MGGIAFVVIVLGYMVILGHQQMLELALALGAVAAVGFWDDMREVPSWARLVVHVVASAFVLYVVVGSSADWPLAAWLGAAVALAWFVNLYNFMDGIDGFAAAQCLVFCLGVQVLSGGVPGTLGTLLWLTSGATLAFLAFNWPPARIFMGDVGSGFLGLLIGGLAVYLAALDVLPLIGSLILLAAFWFDATYTLCVRMLTRQEFTQAHRSHLYQRLAAARGHLWTTVAYLAYACLWLAPLAWVSVHLPYWRISALILSIGPLAILCWQFRAGMVEVEAG
jgi:Fuc2NAc and GlcNAc transferase